MTTSFWEISSCCLEKSPPRPGLVFSVIGAPNHSRFLSFENTFSLMLFFLLYVLVASFIRFTCLSHLLGTPLYYLWTPSLFFTKKFCLFRFQIQDITVVSEEDQATRSAKDALLLWWETYSQHFGNIKRCKLDVAYE